MKIGRFFIVDNADNLQKYASYPVLAWDETGKSVKPKKFAKDNETTLANMDKTVKEILSSL